MPFRHSALSSEPKQAPPWTERSDEMTESENGKTNWSLPPQLWKSVNRLPRSSASSQARGAFFFSQALFPGESSENSVGTAPPPAAAGPDSKTKLAHATGQPRPPGGKRKRHSPARGHFKPTTISEDRLRSLAHQIMIAQEDDRRDLSREILNEVVQNLVGIEAELLSIATEASRVAPGVGSRAARVQRLLEGSIGLLHRLAGDLRPTALDDLGLIPALHAYSRDFASENDVRVHLIAYGAFTDLTEDVRTTIFRVAQEALADALHHGRATETRIEIVDTAGRLRMDITDNGEATASAASGAENRHQLGLLSMSERVEMLGGRLSLGPRPETGHVVSIILPRARENAERWEGN
ncbi:MAG TPA: ATP-binding protein [Candidatus Didemnitutus sp.]|jgi:signal transduction histidine kinase